MKNTLSVLVRNQVGVVAQATEVFRQHNVNLNSISCAETEAFDVSRLMLTVEGQEHLFDAVKADLASKDFVLEVQQLLQSMPHVVGIRCDEYHHHVVITATGIEAS